MTSETPDPKIFDRELLSPEERVPFENAGKAALDLVRDRLKGAWEKRGVSKTEPSSSSAELESSQESDAGDSSAVARVEGTTGSQQSKEVADLISRPGVIDSPMMRAQMVAKEWEEFLARPEGKETAAMLQEVILEEWKVFDQKMYQEALDRKAFVSKKERLRLWETILLPQLKEMVMGYLEERHSIPRRSGGLIFKAIIRELEGAAENKE